MPNVHAQLTLPLLIRTLHCPYCASALEMSCQRTHVAADASYGVIRCACYEYPVVDGIPILRQLDGLRTVVDLIERGETIGALLQALDVFRVTWALRSRWHHVLYRIGCRRLVSGNCTSFQDSVNLVRKPKVFADYLFHRYGNPSFLTAVGLLQLLGTLFQDRAEAAAHAAGTTTHAPDSNHASVAPVIARPRVLDIACGAGHSSFLMRHMFPGLAVFSADHDFVSLYLAKRFLAPHSVHLCLDAEVPSPFPNRYFDAVFCLDAFHYLRPKTAIVTELRRIASREALWLLPHLHNALQHNITPGVPLPPEAYLRCFDGLSPRLFDESKVLHELCRRHVLDLELETPMQLLERAPSLVLVAGPSRIWSIHRRFPEGLCRDSARLAINPLYHQTASADDLKLTLTWPNRKMRHECSGVEALLPSQCRLSPMLRRNLADGTALANIELTELVGRFVLVPLPPHYGRAQVERSRSARNHHIAAEPIP